MDDDGLSQDAVLAFQADPLVVPLVFGLPLGIGVQVAQVPRVPLLRAGPPMLVLFGIEMALGRAGVRGRAIPALMDMEPVLAGGQARHMGPDLHVALLLDENNIS